MYFCNECFIRVYESLLLSTNAKISYQTLLVMLALCLMLSLTYHYAVKIGRSQLYNDLPPKIVSMTKFVKTLKLHTSDFWTLILNNFDILESSPPNVNLTVELRWNSGSQLIRRLHDCLGFKSQLCWGFSMFKYFRCFVDYDSLLYKFSRSLVG